MKNIRFFEIRKEMKKAVIFILTLCIVFALSANAFAMDCIVPADMVPKDSALNVGKRTENLKVGDVIILYKDVSGITYLTVEEKKTTDLGTSKSEVGTTAITNMTLNIKHKNWLGVVSVAVEIRMKCTWYKSGTNSYIMGLGGTYTIYNSSYSCSWNSSYNQSSATYHTRGLDVSNNSNFVTFVFDAALITTNNPPVVNMGYISF